MQKKYKLWINIIIAELIVLIAVLAGISRTRSHSKALPFEIPQDQRTAYGSDDLTAITDNAYWTFVHQRFILVYDDEGVLQWVKIDNQFGRNNYTLIRLWSNRTAFSIIQKMVRLHLLWESTYRSFREQ